MDFPQLNSTAEVDEEALRVGPIRLAFLAPEDREFMQAIKAAYEKKLVVPVLIGREEQMARAAADAAFDTGGLDKIYLPNFQEIADTGMDMMVRGEVDSISKGQMSTNYVYRAVISREKRLGRERVISVTSFWEITPLKHFVIKTDPGVNISPDRDVKAELVRKAAALLRLYGHNEPRVLVLSAKREINGRPVSHEDALHIEETLKKEGLVCTVQSGNFAELFAADPGRRPNILLYPHLVTGNSIIKLDFYLDVRRRGMVMTSWGPVLVPARSDSTSHIVEEISQVVVTAKRFRGSGQ